MKLQTIVGVCALAAGLFWFGGAPAARAGEKLKAGHWRVELSNTTGYAKNSYDRRGDVFSTLIVEYEFPLSQRFSFSFRALPIFVYAQGSSGDASFHGAGLGVATRAYQKKDEHRGFFVELEGGLIAHKNKLRGNTGVANFVTGAGLGYKFKSRWHAVVKLEHISNAGFARRNAGANLLGLGIGYSF